MATLVLRWPSLAIALETVWLPKPNIFIIRPFEKKSSNQPFLHFLKLVFYVLDVHDDLIHVNVVQLGTEHVLTELRFGVR